MSQSRGYYAGGGWNWEIVTYQMCVGDPSHMAKGVVTLNRYIKDMVP